MFALCEMNDGARDLGRGMVGSEIIFQTATLGEQTSFVVNKHWLVNPCNVRHVQNEVSHELQTYSHRDSCRALKEEVNACHLVEPTTSSPESRIIREET